jgi:hypothetical protein
MGAESGGNDNVTNLDPSKRKKLPGGSDTHTNKEATIVGAENFKERLDAKADKKFIDGMLDLERKFNDRKARIYGLKHLEKKGTQVAHDEARRLMNESREDFENVRDEIAKLDPKKLPVLENSFNAIEAYLNVCRDTPGRYEKVDNLRKTDSAIFDLHIVASELLMNDGFLKERALREYRP